MKLIAVFLFSLVMLGCKAAPAARMPGSHAYTPVRKKPVVVLVHGAWGGGWAYRECDDLLSRDGYKVYRPTLTGQGERTHLASPEINLDTHIMDVVNCILYEDLHDVILVGHSYGGMVISGVAHRIPDRIKEMIYVDAMVPENGESCDDILVKWKQKPRESSGGFLIPDWVKPGEALPHDSPQSSKTFSQPIMLTNPEAAKIPTSYILNVPEGATIQDARFYFHYQRAMARGWTMYQEFSDHNMEWSHPVEFVNLVERIIRKY